MKHTDAFHLLNYLNSIGIGGCLFPDNLTRFRPYPNYVILLEDFTEIFSVEQGLIIAAQRKYNEIP
jgi:hypothetical protein